MIAGHAAHAGSVAGSLLGADEQGPQVPSVPDLLWPTLRAVRAIGDSGTIEEIDERVISDEQFSEAQQAVLHRHRFLGSQR